MTKAEDDFIKSLNELCENEVRIREAAEALDRSKRPPISLIILSVLSMLAGVATLIIIYL